MHIGHAGKPIVALAALWHLMSCTPSRSDTSRQPGEPSGIDPSLALESRGGSTHPAAGTTANLGRGFDSLQGEVLGDCVVNSKTISFAGAAEQPGASSDLVVRYARTREELASALGVSVEASATFGFFSGSARAKYAQREDLTSDTTFLVISNEVVNDTQSLETYRLSETADNALRTGGASQFYRMCGDQFVAARVTGGSLHVVVEIRGATRSFTQQVTAGASVQAWLFSAGGEMSTEARRTLAQETTNVEVFQAGGLAHPEDLPSLLSFAFRFRSHVTGSNAKYAAPISFITAPYGIVASSNPINIPALTLQRRKLNELAEWHGTAKTRRKDLIDAQADGRGSCEDRDRKLDAAIHDVELRMKAIEVEAQACVDDPVRGCGNGRARPIPSNLHLDVIKACAPQRAKDDQLAERKAAAARQAELEAQLRDARKGEPGGTPCGVWEVRSVKPGGFSNAAWISVTATADAGGSMHATETRDLFETAGWSVNPELRTPTGANLLVEGKVKFQTGCGWFDGPCQKGDRVVASHDFVVPSTIAEGTVKTNDFAIRLECVQAARGAAGTRTPGMQRQPRRISPGLPPRPLPRARVPRGPQAGG